MHFPTAIETPQNINETAAMLGLSTLPTHTQPPPKMDASPDFYNGERDGPENSYETNSHGAPSRNTWVHGLDKTGSNQQDCNQQKARTGEKQKQLNNSAKVKLEQLSKKKAKGR